MAMKFVVACGGTGGHTFPGLAVAHELRRRGHDVVVWTSGRSIEKSAMSCWDGPVFSTGARQLRIRSLLYNGFSYLRCRREMKRFAPDAILAMGSYSSLPPVMAARAFRVPVVLHEANTVPGRAVDFLSRYAAAVAISFAETAERLHGRRTVLTGLPVRDGIASGERFEDVPADSFCVFVTGGSQGAHRINELATQALAIVRRDAAKVPGMHSLYVIHQTGAADENVVLHRYEEANVPARVKAFENEMARAIATADIVVARAGASTCFELALAGKPAFFMPLPTALRDHQHHNAQTFVRKGAADEGDQALLSARSLANYILNRMSHPETLARMSAAMRSLAVPDAAARTADLLEECARGGAGGGHVVNGYTEKKDEMD